MLAVRARCLLFVPLESLSRLQNWFPLACHNAKLIAELQVCRAVLARFIRGMSHWSVHGQRELTLDAAIMAAFVALRTSSDLRPSDACFP